MAGLATFPPPDPAQPLADCSALDSILSQLFPEKEDDSRAYDDEPYVRQE